MALFYASPCEHNFLVLTQAHLCFAVEIQQIVPNQEWGVSTPYVPEFHSVVRTSTNKALGISVYLYTTYLTTWGVRCRENNLGSMSRESEIPRLDRPVPASCNNPVSFGIIGHGEHLRFLALLVTGFD